jgi:hypothetical protein
MHAALLRVHGSMLANHCTVQLVAGNHNAARVAMAFRLHCRCRQGSLHTRLECTATILPGKAGGLKGRSSPALDVKPRCAAQLTGQVPHANLHTVLQAAGCVQ